MQWRDGFVMVVWRAAVLAGIQCVTMTLMSVLFLLRHDLAHAFVDAFRGFIQLAPSLSRYEAYFLSRAEPDEATWVVAIYFGNLVLQGSFAFAFSIMAWRIAPGWRDRPVARRIPWTLIGVLIGSLGAILLVNHTLIFGPRDISRATALNRVIRGNLLHGYLLYCWMLPFGNAWGILSWHSLNASIYSGPPPRPLSDVLDAFTPAQPPPAGRRAGDGGT
jgi:hypothetical protein